MKIIGLTGGIGSGKTLVGQLFQQKGISVYNSDDRAKQLMNSNEDLIHKMKLAFGEEAYSENGLNRKFISEKVFNQPALLQKLNQTVHPYVFDDFKNWLTQESGKFVVKEAAILFESGSYKDCDWIISVVADEEKRIQRVMERDDISREDVVKRITSQWTDAQKIQKSTYFIENNASKEDLEFVFEKLYQELLSRVEIG